MVIVHILKNQSVFQNRNLPIETVRSSDDRVDKKKKTRDTRMKKLVHDNSTAVLGIQGTDSKNEKLKPTCDIEN